jgi:DNA-binding LacI/PurR family transcriptional regulator
VHVSTVSRVLSGRGDSSIRPETKQRILESAARLRYRPHALARGLRLSTTGALGWLVPSLRNPNNSPIIRGAFDRAWELGYVLVIAEDSAERATAEEAYARLVDEGRIDGLAIQSARAGNSLLDTFVAGSVPCVFVDRRHPGSGCNVAMRDGDAGQLAAEHLLDLGHTRLGHLAGPLEIDTTRRRHDGFIAAADARGASVVVEVAELNEQAGYDAMEQLLGRRGDVPTAIFIANVNQTIGALAALRSLGVRVPDDLSVVCHDDDIVLDYVDPQVTAIRMPLLRLGAAAIDALVARIEGGAAQDVVVDEAPTLVDRASTAGPA